MLATTRLSDGVIELRPPRESDIDGIFGAVRESIPEVMPWMEWCHADYSRVETAEWVRITERSWDQDIDYPFVVFGAESHDVLGTCGLNALDRQNRWANLGYWMRTSATGHGYATRAARLTASFGFSQLGLDRIEILAATGNARSQAVAQRCGATREGTLRSRLRIRDDVQDAAVFSIIRSEWR